MGDWYPTADGRWTYDPAAPSPGANPALTQILNAVTPSCDEHADIVDFLVHPDEFPAFDDVDSTSIDDPGAPA